MSITLRQQAIDSLCRLLATGDEADRCYVIRSLGVLKATSAIEPLIERLRDEDLDVCVDAAGALGLLGDPRAIPQLLESLEKDPDGEVRSAIVEALGLVGGQEVVPALLDIAANRPENLEWQDDWDDWWDMQLKAVDALGRMGEVSAIPVLESVLGFEDGQDIESETLSALARIDGEALPLLEKILKQGTPRERRRAARALGNARSDASLRLLVEGLLDKQAEVRAATLGALGERRAVHYMKVLLISLKDPAEEVRSEAIRVIQSLAPLLSDLTEVKAKILTLLGDPSPQVRHSALQFLNQTSDGAAIDAEIQGQVRNELSGRDPLAALAACAVSAHCRDSEALPALLALLDAPSVSDQLRREAALAIGQIGLITPQVVTALRDALLSEQQPVRLGALSALMQLEQDGEWSEASTTEEASPEYPIDILLAAISGAIVADEEEEEQAPDDIEAAEAPSETPSTSAPTSTIDAIARENVEAMMQMSDAPSEDENLQRAAELSREQNDEEFGEYISMVQHNLKGAKRHKKRKHLSVEEDIQQLAVRIIGALENNEAVEALLQTLSHPDIELRRDAIDSIGRIAEVNPQLPALQNAYEAILNHLLIGEAALHSSAIRTLARLGNRAAIDTIASRLTDSDFAVRSEAIKALIHLINHGHDGAENSTKIDREALLMQISDALTDRDPDVRKTAASAMVEHLQHADNGTPQLVDHVIDKMISAAALDQGNLARPMGKLLRRLDDQKSAAQVLQLLDTLPTSLERRFAIELLEELLKSSEPSAEQVA